MIFALSLICLVAYVVTIFAGAPPEIEAWKWTMPAGAAAFALPAYLLHRSRRRRLRITRHGDAIKLAVPEAALELDFPLECRGTQFIMRVNRVPMHEVFLQLVDGKRRGVVLHETRGAIHGPERNWFKETLDRTVPSQQFDVSGAGTLAEVRDWVERLNRQK